MKFAKRNKKELNFELNLMPMMDILAVCITFLMLTAVWVKVGAVGLTQSSGSSQFTAEATPILIVEVKSLSEGEVYMKNVKGPSRQRLNFKENWHDVLQKFAIEAQQGSKEKIDTSIVLASPDAQMDQLVAVMDDLKKSNMKNVGVSDL